MLSPRSRSVRLALKVALAAGLTTSMLTGCGDELADASSTPVALQGSARGGSGGQAGNAEASAGKGGTTTAAGAAGGPAVLGGSGGSDGARHGGASGSAGSAPDGNEHRSSSGYAGGDAGFCNPTLVVMLPVPALGAAEQIAKVQIHADTTSDLLGTASNRYEAICGESDGDDLLVGLDVPETGTLTLALSAASKQFQGVLSVERGVCKGTLGATDGCASAEQGGITQLSLVVTKGEHLFVFVDTPAGRGGEFNLVATLVASP